MLITHILSSSLKAPTIKETRIHVFFWDYIRISSEPAIFFSYHLLFYFFFLLFLSLFQQQLGYEKCVESQH